MSPLSRSVFWALVRKDLYLQRGIVAGGVVSGLLALVLMAFGKVGFAVGGILYLSFNIVCFVFVSMFSLVTERAEQSRLFAPGIRGDAVRRRASRQRPACCLPTQRVPRTQTRKLRSRASNP